MRWKLETSMFEGFLYYYFFESKQQDAEYNLVFPQYNSLINPGNYKKDSGLRPQAVYILPQTLTSSFSQSQALGI